MRPLCGAQHALRCAWANLPLLSAPATYSNATTHSYLHFHALSHSPALTLAARSLHTSAHLFRQRRWRASDNVRARRRDLDDTDEYYKNYTAAIQPLDAATDPPTIVPLSNVLVTSTTNPTTNTTHTTDTSNPTTTSTSAPNTAAVVQLTAVRESAPPPPPSSAAYRTALFAARDARRATEALKASVHGSGPSRRVRRWQSLQKRLRTRADRRRRKYEAGQATKSVEQLEYKHMREEAYYDS